MKPESLTFFNSIAGRLEIELSEPAAPFEGMANEIATPTATVKSVKLTSEIFERDTKTFRDLTEEERNQVALAARWIVLRGEADIPVRHRAPNGVHFTVDGLLTAVEETERQTRGQSGWFDGVDVHHVFFEGIRQTRRFPNREWTINWGS